MCERNCIHTQLLKVDFEIKINGKNRTKKKNNTIDIGKCPVSANTFLPVALFNSHVPRDEINTHYYSCFTNKAKMLRNM